MPQAVWVGRLSFGLVSIPVRLYGATSPKTVRFHHYEAGTGRRVRYRRVAEDPAPERPRSVLDEQPQRAWPDHGATRHDAAPEPARLDEPADEAAAADATQDDDDAPARDAAAEVEVPWGDVVKGYEIEPGRVVTVGRDELEEIAPERSRVLEIERFVDLGDVDPVHFDKSYFVVPQHGTGAERPYWLLYRAMEAAGKAAVGRFVMRTREHLAAVRPAGHVLMLHTLFHADEVRDAKDVWAPLVAEPRDDELRAAGQFLDALAARWEPERHRDEHRERLLELLRAKAGDALAPPEPEEERAGAPLGDLMEALKASVDAAKRARSDRRSDAG